MLPAALICSVLANINRDPERRMDPYLPADFMPGALTEEDEMREFAEAVARGETFEPDPDMVEDFKHRMQQAFSNIVTASPPRRELQ